MRVAVQSFVLLAVGTIVEENVEEVNSAPGSIFPAEEKYVLGSVIAFAIEIACSTNLSCPFKQSTFMCIFLHTSDV